MKKSAGRDRGTTLIEMILAITLIGIVMGSVTAAVVVLFRNTSATTERVSAAQDVRQLVNYFPGDVRSASWNGVEIHETGVTAESACPGIPAASQTLHLGLSSTDGRTRTEYRSSTSAGAASLHRWTCTRAGVGQPFGSAQRVRIGDDLHPVRPVTVVRAGDRVELEMHRASGGVASLAASPFVADEPLVIAAPESPPDPDDPDPSDPDDPEPVGPTGPCPTIGVPETHGFTVMTAGHAVLHNQAGDFHGPIAVGGNLTFKNNGLSTLSPGTFVVPGSGRPTALLVGGMIDWPDSGGGFLNVHGGYVHVGDLANWREATGGPAGQLRLTDTDGSQNRQIRIHGTDQTLGMVHQPGVLEFGAMFAVFRSISGGLVDVPAGCPGATVGELLAPDGSTGWSSGDALIHHRPGHATVLTMSMAEYSALGRVGLATGSAAPGRNNPLVITITDGGTVRMPAGDTHLSRDHVPYVLWNFPNADRVVTGGTFWGTILAPDAVVEQHADIRGNVIAERLESHRGIVTLQQFEGVFPWS